MRVTSARQVETIKKVGKHPVGGNLYLKVTPTGTKSWVFRFSSGELKTSKAGKSYRAVEEMGLGPFPDISLAAAREAATAQRALRRQKIDPIKYREELAEAKKQEERALTTFGECATVYIAERGKGWKNPKHKKQWASTLKNDARALWDLPVAAIDTPVMLEVLRPIWRTKSETASRVRARIERIIAWSMVNGYRPEGHNPARWRGHLQEALPPKPAVEHFKALPFMEIPALMQEIRALKSVSARAFFRVLHPDGNADERGHQCGLVRGRFEKACLDDSGITNEIGSTASRTAVAPLHPDSQ